MGRFLTPSKIALLVLAQVYVKGSVPASGVAKVLDTLLSGILFDADPSDRGPFTSDDSILAIERSLSGQASVITGRSVWNIFLKHLWAIDCSDSLEWFVSEMVQYLGKTRDELLKERDEGLQVEPAGPVVRNSPLGLFIRRCSIELVKMQFQESISLWIELVAYRMPTKAAFVKRNPQSMRNAFDSTLVDFDIDNTHQLVGIMFRPLVENMAQQQAYSMYDSEKLMEFQVSEMQSVGGRLPDAMKTRLKHMASLGASTPKLVHYLKFLDSWRAGDFNSAFDNLHRYFDYTMHSRDRIYYQYALLNLAILQADFGCHDEAIPAMQEAIATARENRDSVCLNYCMSWLYHFGRSFPAQMRAIRETGILGNEAEGLNFLKSRAKEAEMWTLLSTSLLSEAKIALQHGDSLAMCFENIVKSAHINIVKSIPNGTGPALLMKTTLFARIGQAHMARSCGERFLLCHTLEAPLEDTLKCTVRQANLLAQMGRAAEAQETLASLPTHILKVLKFEIYHTTAARILQARRLLHRGDLDSAGYIISRLVTQQPHPEIDTSTQVSLLHIDLLTRRKELVLALEKVEALAISAPIENNDVHLLSKLLTLKAGLLAKSDRALGGFSLVMRAVDMSYRARALPALWDAVMALGIVLSAAYEFTATRDLLVAILPQVLEWQDCELTGRIYIVLADAYVGLAGFVGTKDNATSEDKAEQKMLMGKAMTMLEKANEQFRWVEELDGQLEAFAKMARICVWRGDTELAAQMSEQYMDVKTRYETEEI